MPTYRFKPPLIGTLAVLLLLPIFIGLGLWQLERGALKQHWHQTFTQQQAYPPITLTQALVQPSDLSKLYWRRAQLQGHFLAQPQLLLDNQRLQGKVGYAVFTPFQLADSNDILWVNRGWLPIRRQRDNIPDLPVSSERQTIQGTLRQAPPQPALVLDTALTLREKLRPGLWRVQVFEPVLVSEWLNLSSLPLVLQQSDPDYPNLNQHWEPPGSDEQRHYGYALQWFSFAGVLLLLSLFFSVRRVSPAT
jgi:surfeit locus 1 family protein